MVISTTSASNQSLACLMCILHVLQWLSLDLVERVLQLLLKGLPDDQLQEALNKLDPRWLRTNT